MVFVIWTGSPYQEDFPIWVLWVEPWKPHRCPEKILKATFKMKNNIFYFLQLYFTYAYFIFWAINSFSQGVVLHRCWRLFQDLCICKLDLRNAFSLTFLQYLVIFIFFAYIAQLNISNDMVFQKYYDGTFWYMLCIY